MTVDKMRRIQSFVRRDGRMTEAQERAITVSWPSVGLQLTEGMIDYSAI